MELIIDDPSLSADKMIGTTNSEGLTIFTLNSETSGTYEITAVVNKTGYTPKAATDTLKFNAKPSDNDTSMIGIVSTIGLMLMLSVFIHIVRKKK